MVSSVLRQTSLPLVAAPVSLPFVCMQLASSSSSSSQPHLLVFFVLLTGTDHEQLAVELETVPTRILMDIFHLMYRIKCNSSHALRLEFFQAFRDLLLRPDADDKATIQ